MAEYLDIEADLSRPEVHADPARARRLGRRFAELRPIIADYRSWLALGADAQAAAELAPRIRPSRPRLKHSPGNGKRSPSDYEPCWCRGIRWIPSDIIVEVKAGEGGAESALFAGDLLRMYQRHAERRGWSSELLELEESDLGGVKDARWPSRPAPSTVPTTPLTRPEVRGWRAPVQRVPVTESSGGSTRRLPGSSSCPKPRTSTSTSIRPTFVSTSSVPADPAARVSTPPTRRCASRTCPPGLVVSCQNEKSQLQNREQALRILRSRLLVIAQEEAAQEASDARRAQVRTVDRSERVHLQLPENRISDHRVGFQAHNLDAVPGR